MWKKVCENRSEIIFKWKENIDPEMVLVYNFVYTYIYKYLLTEKTYDQRVIKFITRSIVLWNYVYRILKYILLLLNCKDVIIMHTINFYKKD